MVLAVTNWLLSAWYGKGTVVLDVVVSGTSTKSMIPPQDARKGNSYSSGTTVRPVLLKKNRDSVTSENSRFAFLFCYRRLASALGPHVALFARDLESQQNTTTHASLPMNTSILIGDCRRLFARSCNTPRNQDLMVRRRSAQSHWHDGRGGNWWGATSIRQSHILLSTLWR
jgi:hypothetical protein